MKKLRILLADDHAMFRAGIKTLIDAQPDMGVIGEAAHGRAALKNVRELKPDVLVMDISMPEMNGLQLMEQIKRANLTVRMLVLTAFSDAAYLRQLLTAGAAGYLLKHAASEELIKAIRLVADGGTYLDPAVARKVITGFVEQKKLRGSREGDELSERESGVLRLVARGHTNKEISSQLEISVKTVETHKANLMDKLGLRSRAEIVRYALQQGWLEEV